MDPQKIVFGFIAVTAFFIGAVKMYGIYAVVTGRRCKHAAVGRAKYKWITPVRDHRLTMYRATEILAELAAERIGKPRHSMA